MTSNLPKLGQLVGVLQDVSELAERAGHTLSPWTDWWRYPGGHGGLIADVIRAQGPPDRLLGRSDHTSIVVDRLWLRQIPSSATAKILNLDKSNIDRYLTRSQRPPRDEWYHAQIVWQEHCSGQTPMQISKDHGIPRSRVYRILDKHTDYTHRKLNEPADESKVSDVIGWYRDNVSYDDMVHKSGLSLSVLKRLLARLHQEGRLPEYGSRPGGRPSKETE